MAKTNKLKKETKVNLPSQQLAKNISLQVPERLQCLSLQKAGGDVEEILPSILPTDQSSVLLLKAAGSSGDSTQQYQ